MKKILFIAPNYFDYYKIIQKSLVDKGYDVTWMDDRPSNNIFEKCILRVKPSLLRGRIDNYFNDKIKNEFERKQYDIVFVIMGQSFNSKHFLNLKRLNSKCNFVLYLWDNTRNFPGLVDLATAFDKVYSFDKFDCKKYGYLFLPLFYSFPHFDNQDIIYDASFIGTIKNGKLPLVNNIVKDLESNNLCVMNYMYLQSKLVYMYYRIKDKDFTKTKIKDFKYKKMSYIDNINKSLQSRIIIDVPMKNQVGLSMRTIECMAMKRKLITTNEDVVNYDFYRPENIYVYKGKIDFKDVFFTEEYLDIDKNIVDDYSLEKWIDKIIEEK